MAADKMPFSITIARAEEEEAPVLELKAKKAKPEEATITAKAEAQVETITTEEALMKFIAQLEKEEDFLDAKAEAEKQAGCGCGSKRKPELERDEEGAAFVARIEAMKPPTDQVEYSDGNVWDGYDSQEDPETSFRRVMARLERHIQANNARCPFLIGGDGAKSPELDADGAIML